MLKRLSLPFLGLFLAVVSSGHAGEVRITCSFKDGKYLCKQLSGEPVIIVMDDEKPVAPEVQVLPSSSDPGGVRCVPHSNGKSHIPQINGRELGEYYFGSKERCESAIASAGSGWICIITSKKGEAVAFSLKEDRLYGEYAFDSAEQCQKSLATRKDDLMCTAGPSGDSYIPFDLELLRVAGRHYYSSMAECEATIRSGAAARSRSALLSESELGDCSDLRLDAPGGSMEHVAVRDQGELPICFAEVAVQFADAWRFSHGDKDYGFQSSGLFAALKTHHADNVWELEEGGREYVALKQLAVHGTCSKDVTIEILNSSDRAQIIRALKNIRYRKDNSPLKEVVIQKDEQEVLERSYHQQDCLSCPCPLPAFTELQKRIQEANPRRLFFETLTGSCKDKNLKRVSLPELRWGFSGSTTEPKELASYLLSHLKTAGDMPIALSVCSEIFYNAHHRMAFSRNGRSNCSKDFHAMLAIGKRRNPATGRCQFLLRNSWGLDCGASGKNFECENGSIWMDVDTLAYSLERVDELIVSEPVK